VAAHLHRRRPPSRPVRTPRRARSSRRVRHSPSIAAVRRTFFPPSPPRARRTPARVPSKLHRIEHQWKSRGTKTARPGSARIWTRPRAVPGEPPRAYRWGVEAQREGIRASRRAPIDGALRRRAKGLARERRLSDRKA
jgi:hypothetical protein